MTETDESTAETDVAGAERHIRVVGTTVEWCCRACSHWQRFDHDLCDACGTPRRRFHRVKSPSFADGVDGAAGTPDRDDAADAPTGGAIAVAAPLLADVDEPVAGVDEAAPGDHVDAAPLSPRRIAPLDGPSRMWLVVASVLVPGSGHMVLRRFGTGLTRMIVFVAWMTSGAIWLGDYAAATQRAVWAVLAGVVILGVISAVDVAALRRGESELVGPRGLLALVITVTLAILVVPRGALFWGWMLG